MVSASVLVSGSHDLDLRKALDNYTFGAGIHHVSGTSEGAIARASQYDVDVIVIINHHTVSRCTSCGNPWMTDILSPEKYYEDVDNGFSTDRKDNIIVHSGMCPNCARSYID